VKFELSRIGDIGSIQELKEKQSISTYNLPHSGSRHNGSSETSPSYHRDEKSVFRLSSGWHWSVVLLNGKQKKTIIAFENVIRCN